MKSAIVIGASSGIGRDLAKLLSQNGYRIGVAARRRDLLATLQAELSAGAVIKEMDVSQPGTAMRQLRELLDEMQEVELIVISAGTGAINLELDWSKEAATIDTNVTGFAAIANVAIAHFVQRGSGHLVGISSIAALRGSDVSPAYYASKAFQSNYLQGLRKKMVKSGLPITITEVQPGLVDTAMAQGEGLFWVAPVEKVARQIYDAIIRRKEHVYVTKRWRLIAWLLKALPASIYNRK